jgi:NADH-quinone oxidoreductase subunit H
MYAFFTSQFGFSLALMLVLLGLILTAVAYCILAERKISAWIQDRLGPNRVGPAGLLQPLADGVKFVLKEDILTAHVDRPLFILAPAISFIIATIGFAIIPWAGDLRFANGRTVLVQVASVDVGILYILGVGAMTVYGVVIGGWASNNKFSFYGGMRATAQMLSYEIPMGLGILVIVLTGGQLRLEHMVTDQLGSTWYGLLHPLTFLVVLVASLAETHRMPFDLAEAEQELVGGYQTEYSSMKMALFYLGEYAHLITAGALLSTLFLGGWELFPWSERTGWAWTQWLNHAPTWPAMILRFAIVLGKIVAFIVFTMWLRWTLPRFRFDQLMRLAWRGMVPLGLALVAWATAMLYRGHPTSIWTPVGEVALFAIGVMWVSIREPRISGRQEHLPELVGSE